MKPVSTMAIHLVIVTVILTNINTGGDVTCDDGKCPPRCVNVSASRECFQCQDSRFYGKRCENVCPHTCVNSRCQLSNSRVVCTEGCVVGKREDNCGDNCPPSCTQCPKYNNASCRELCLGNCEGGCDRYSWECKSCQSGYRGRYCNSCESGYRGQHCNETCSSNCEDGCDRVTGVCYRCKSGYRGNYCNEACTPACRDGCDRYTGECYVYLTTTRRFTYSDAIRCKDSNKQTGECRECENGYRGKYCNVTCSSNCDICDRETGECKRCKNGYSGRHCKETCSSNCKICDRFTWKCYWCKDGYRGIYCIVACPSNCGRCKRDTGECVRCKKGYRGKHCNVTCPSNCIICDRSTDNCARCMGGYRGRYCNVTCPSNCERCHNMDGCYMCNSGYHGKYCNTTCLPNCKHGCDRYTGECRECQTGHRDRYCNLTCPPNCKDGCDRYTGECDNCVSDHTGRHCNSNCNVNCQDCDWDTGQCQTCVNGKKGHYCNESCLISYTRCTRYTGPCPSKHVYGRNCSTPCSVACNGCDRYTGICTECSPGYSRTFCDEMCSLCGNKNCSSEHCLSSETTLLLKAICGTLAVILLLASAACGGVWLRRKLRCRIRLQIICDSNHEQAYDDITDHSDRNQYLATKYWEIKNEDLDSDPVMDNVFSGQRPQRPASSAQVLKKDPPSCRGKKKTGHNNHSIRLSVSNPCDHQRDLLPNVDIILKNNIYGPVGAVGGACAAAVDVDLKTTTSPDGVQKLIQKIDEGSMTSEESFQSEAILFGPNEDLSNVYVKYITPSSSDYNFNMNREDSQ